MTLILKWILGKWPYQEIVSFRIIKYDLDEGCVIP